MYIQRLTTWHAKPITEDFDIKVVSKHPEFNDRAFRQHTVGGLKTIGVFGNEPFEIHLTNNYSDDINARVSLDGVDVLTGKEADLEPNSQMWLVRAKTTLHLKAWHESSNGGSRLVFATADKSVSLHTTGSVSHKGIIAVAIFTEADRTWVPTKITDFHHDRYSFGDRKMRTRSVGDTYSASSFRLDSEGSRTLGLDGEVNCTEVPVPVAAGGSNFINVDLERSIDINDLKKEAAIGAGEYTAQKTRTVTGLRKPELHSITRIKYMWFDDLVAAVKQQADMRDEYPTGFPAAKIKSFADLSMVPKVESLGAKDNCVQDGVSRFA